MSSSTNLIANRKRRGAAIEANSKLVKTTRLLSENVEGASNSDSNSDSRALTTEVNVPSASGSHDSSRINNAMELNDSLQGVASNQGPDNGTPHVNNTTDGNRRERDAGRPILRAGRAAENGSSAPASQVEESSGETNERNGRAVTTVEAQNDTEEPENGEEERQRRQISGVWKYFEEDKTNGTVVCVCG